MISTIEPAAVLPPPAPTTPDPGAAPAPARTQGLQSLGSSPLPAPAVLPDLTPQDEAYLSTFLDASLSLTAIIRHHQLTLQKFMDWWRQPHIKAAVATLTELSQARASLLASDDATRAVTALQSCTVLSDVNFYEQADPATRQRAFESARKAANSVLKLAGLPKPRPRPAPAGRGVRGSARTERGVPVSEPTSGCHGSSGSAASRAQPASNGSVNGHANGHAQPEQPPSHRVSRSAS